jgi:hypothetical protein
MTRLLLLPLLLVALAACSSTPAGEVASLGGDQAVVTLHDEVVEASCAMCEFGWSSLRDCRTAIRVGGQVYLAHGACVPDSEDHGTGLCHAILKARVSGRIEGGDFYADSFTLLP